MSCHKRITNIKNVFIMKKPHSLESSYFQKLETEMEKRAVREKSHLEGFRTTALNASGKVKTADKKKQRLYEEIFNCGNLTRHENGDNDEYFRVLAEMEKRAVCGKKHLENFRITAPNVSTVDEDEQRKRLYEEIFKCGGLTRHEDGGSDEYFRVLAEMENRYRR